MVYLLLFIRTREQIGIILNGRSHIQRIATSKFLPLHTLIITLYKTILSIIMQKTKHRAATHRFSINDFVQIGSLLYFFCSTNIFEGTIQATTCEHLNFFPLQCRKSIKRGQIPKQGAYRSRKGKQFLISNPSKVQTYFFCLNCFL